MVTRTVSGNEYVLSDHVSSGLEILHNGQLFVSSGGIAIDTTVDSGGLTNSGYFNPGSLFVYFGGVASTTKLRGTEIVVGVESGGTVFASGSMTVDGTAFGVIISGAGVTPNPDPPPSTFTGPPAVNNTGELILYGSAGGTVLSGGLELVDGGTDSGTTVSSGGWQWVGGGTAISTTLSSGGWQELVGGTASGATIDSGGLQYDAGTAISTTISGGTQIVTGNGRTIGSASGTIIESGGSQVVSNRAVANLTDVHNGGKLYVQSAGAAGRTTLSGGTEFVSSGGNAFTTTISSGGTQIVSSGGSAGGEQAGGVQGSTTISTGGTQILSGGTSFNTTISSGGQAFVSFGGVATSTTISNAAVEDVWSGGTAYSTNVAGGYAYIASGGTALGAKNITGGGTLELAGGAVIDSTPITFAGAGNTLQIDGAAMPTCTISGFTPGNTIDLRAVRFNDQGLFAVSGLPNQLFSSAGAYTLLKRNNVLELVENGQAYDLQLDPLQKISGGFLLAPDATGGTKITAYDTPVGGYSTSAPPAGPVPFDPYGAVCFVNTDLGFATGFIIGPHSILTAAHVVLGPTGLVNRIAVYPGDESGIAATPVASGALLAFTDPNYVYSNSGTKSLAMYQHDYAIIDVAQNLSGFGSFQIGTFAAGNVNITGYPGIAGGRQYNDIAQASVDATVPGLIDETNAATYPGDSGGPVWVVNGGTVSAVGIHVAGNGAGSGNAVLFTASVVHQIQAWQANYAALGASVLSGQTILGTTVPAGHYLDVFAAGTADETTVDNGGTENVFGRDVGASVNDGGVQVVEPGGVADYARLNDPGVQIVSSGGLASGTLDGGVELVLSGGTAVATTISGGKEELAAGAVVSGGIVFAGTGGTLQIDGTVMPANVVSGFVAGNIIDLAGVAFDSAGTVQLVSGHVLEVVESSIAYDLLLDSSQRYPTHGFRVTSDGSGGTDIIRLPETAPVVTAPDANVAVGHQSPVSVTSLFTASDPDGDDIVQYDFWDSGQAGGHWLLNGAALPSGKENFVDAAQLSKVTYQGGGGTETIWVRASDGLQYGAWTSITATDTAPVVTRTGGATVNVGHGTVAAASLFTASDADGDGIVQYDFYDSGQAGGHWLLNGVAQPDNQTISISASQLAQMTYRGGSGTETIWERASDGVQFGAWVSLNATGTESAPAVAPTSASVVASYKSSVAATTLFTVCDRDGDAITQYDFWDNGAGGGHWSINGVAQGSNVEIIVNASQLSQVTYTPGAGTDTLFVRANDGLLWSAWTVGFSATDVAPVSTPLHNSVSGAGNRTYAFSNLFTVGDADGDQAAVYDFWDNGAGGGHWSINGVVQGSNQEILVNASQLSQVTYQSGSGTDTLFLRASDGLHFGAWTQGVSVVNAPVANPNQSAFTLSHTQSVAATTLFTAADADGDPITKYDFWDNGMGGGHWSINGAAQGSNVEIIVNASQLSQVTYTPGAGTDTLFVRVNDGTQWSAWTPGFTAADAAPVSTWYTNSLVARTGQTFAASNLFTASDADTDGITQYDFWDNGTGGGHWSVNGVAKGSNQEIVVNASQLSQVTYTAGTGTDSLFVRTNDGLQWGPWTPAFPASGGPQPSSVTVPGGGGVEIGTAGSHTDASFVSNTGTLTLDDSQHYAGTVAGLVGQDSLDLADINFINGATTATLINATSAGGTLHVTDGTHQANIALLGNYMASMFVSASDGHGGTSVVDPPALGGVQPLVTPPHA